MYNERAIKRAMAIKQYRFLLKLIKLAEEKRLYSISIEYREEARNIKEFYNL